MRRLTWALVVLALVATGCGGNDTTPSTIPATTTTSATTTTATAAPVEDRSAEPWDSAIAERLVALEEANGGEWTVDTAVEATALVRQVLLEGTETEAPIDTTRLTVFLLENLDKIPQDQWDLTLAAGINARPAAFLQTEEERAGYQFIAEDANREFERLTGHTLTIPIYVALTDLATPLDLYAGSISETDNIDALEPWFGSESLFTDTKDALAELNATEGGACLIILSQFLRTWTPDRQGSGILHEIVHCHQETLYPGGRGPFMSSRTKWMDEGYAAWAGEALFGGTHNSIPWWNEYFRGGVGSSSDGYLLFRGSYNAIPFYSMLAAGGVDPYAQFVSWFGDLRPAGVSNVERYNTMTAGVPPDLIAGWAASSSRNNELGSPWNSATGPGIGGSSANREPRIATAGPDLLGRSVDAGEQRYWSMQFSTDFDEPSLITLTADGFGTYKWEHDVWDEQYVLAGDSFARTWCVGEDCTCEDGTSPAPGALPAPLDSGDTAVLHAALFGAGGPSSFAASIETLEDACEEEEEPPIDAGPLDACLFGVWNPDPEQFQALLLTQYQGLGISDMNLGGTLNLSFNEDGTFRQDYAGVVGTGIVEGNEYEATLSGGSFGRWTASAGVITLSFEGQDITLFISEIGGGAVPPVPLGSAQAGYECGPTTLTIEPPTIAGGLLPFPTDWTKTG